ncbi:MAG: hypothetical protein GJU73_05310 [Ferrovum sp.]|jgi:hypothetical protein|uniref:hypothetical protein n=1 Tax=Ferrovum sp. TaxID=2609467 RepID=UPI002619B903|nr:hypothetical protein [Ferrovum sp.]MBW8066847.1 hypothetical protein [Ferrovum sp.]
MPTLHLGVVDMAYSDPDASGANTTGAVAEILEKKYHVMELFADTHRQELLDLVADAIGGQLESARSGIVPSIPEIDVQKLDAAFRDFLDTNEIQKLLPKRIAAADEGVTSRKKLSKEAMAMIGKKPKRKAGQPRPAFIDSGLYQASFRSWITN